MSGIEKFLSINTKSKKIKTKHTTFFYSVRTSHRHKTTLPAPSRRATPLKCSTHCHPTSRSLILVVVYIILFPQQQQN
jgi:hypothetical protein